VVEKMSDRVRVEIDPSLEEGELIIRCRDEALAEKYRELLAKAPVPLVFFKGKQEYRFPVDEVLFFETGGDDVYAHTAEDEFRTRERLYELAEILPPHFLRVSKSAILNTRRVYSIQRNLTASSLVEFGNSHKVLYVSRLYYKALRNHLQEER